MVVAVIGMGLRLWILQSRLGPPTSDEAVVGLMARHLLHGHPTAFYLGQAYGGSQEAVLVALTFSVVRSWNVAMRVVPITLHAVAALLVWRIGRRIFDDARGRTAAMLVWVGPLAAVWLSTRELAFYGPTLVLGLTLVLLALRLVERPYHRDVFLAGLAGGLGWWASPQIVYFAFPAAVWMLVRRPELVRMAWLAVCAALVGAIPWLYVNVGNGFPSLHPPVQAVQTTYGERLRLFFRTGLPVALGLRKMGSTRWLVPWIGPAVYVAVLAALAVAGVACAAAFVRHRRLDGRGLLLFACVVYPFVFALSPFAFYVLDGRYLFFIVPFLALLAASALADRWRQLAAVVVVAALSAGGLASLLAQPELDPIGAIAYAHPLGPLLSAMDDRGVDFVFADYWTAYRIDLATEERVSATPVLGNTRDLALLSRVRSSDRPGYVLVAGSSAEQRLEDALGTRNITYQRVRAGDYALYLPDVTVLPESVPGF